MFDTILIPTDGSPGATAAADLAIDIADQYGAIVHVLHVVDVRMSPLTREMDHDEVVALLEESDEDPIAPILERVRDAGIPAHEAIRLGVPHETIREYIDERDVDLVVMGTHGRTGLERALLGSVTERVVRTADVPVLTVHPNPN